MNTILEALTNKTRQENEVIHIDIENKEVKMCAFWRIGLLSYEACKRSENKIVLVAQSYLTARLSNPWDFPGKNIGVGCHFFLQGICPTQGLISCLLCLLHWQVGSLPLAWPKSKFSFIFWICLWSTIVRILWIAIPPTLLE